MNDQDLVVKSNKLNEARYRLTTQEQRIILTMLAQIKKNDKDFKEYSFTVKEFVDLVGITGKGSYGYLKKITASLRNKGFTIHEPDGDLQVGWLDSVKYYDNEGRFELAFSPKLKPYLLALKKEFTRYQLHNVIRLKSSYSVRIYELLKQYQSIQHRIFDLNELRSILGIPEDSLKLYGDFKRRVLETAHKELANSDILFEYTPIKKVRKVVAVRFYITENESVIKRSKKEKKNFEKEKVIYEKQLDLELENEKQADLNARLISFEGLYPKEYEKLKNQAKKRLTKKQKQGPGTNTHIKFKMQKLLNGFLQKEKIGDI